MEILINPNYLVSKMIPNRIIGMMEVLMLKNEKEQLLFIERKRL
jgi:hypothetical protein